MKLSFMKITSLLLLIFFVVIDCKKKEKGDGKTPDLIKVQKESLYPEGVTYDPKGKRYFLSSLKEGIVLEVKDDGTNTKFIDDPTLISTIGIKVDEQRDRILVCNSDPGASVKTSPKTQKKVAGIGIFGLADGKKIAYHDLAKLNASDTAQFCNDIAIDNKGNIYVTNSFAPVIYKIPTEGEASIFFKDDRFLGESFNLNGIVFHPNGYLIVAKYNEGILFKIPVDNPKNFSEVLLDKPLLGADGLLWDEDSNLIVIANLDTNKVFLLSGKDEWDSATITSELTVNDTFPTTGTKRGNDYYYLESKLNHLFSGNDKDTEFEIKKIQFTKKSPTDNQ